MTLTDEQRPTAEAGSTVPTGLVTSQPSRRSVMARRLAAVLAVAAAAAGLGWVVAVDPFDWFGRTSIAVDTAGNEAAPEVAGNGRDGGAAGGSGLQSEPVDGAVPAPGTATASDGAEPSAASEPLVVTESVAIEPATRFVDLATTRILDTRTPPPSAGDDGEARVAPIDPGGAVTAEVVGVVPADAVGLVLSVNVAMAEGPGPISVDAGADSVTAIDVAKAGQMTTNLVIVPHRRGAPVQVATVGGGHLVVDVVGYFVESEAVSAGRFVPVPTQRIARLVTEVDGREAVVSPLANPALPASGVSSVLVRITADVGGDGGMVRLGGRLDALPNTMMWAATSGDDRSRQGVAIVSLSELDELAFTYNGGVVLDLDVLGYFTDESALSAESGLFHPVTGVEPITVEVSAGSTTTVDAAAALGRPADQVGAVPVNVFATADGVGELHVASAAQATPASATVELGPGRRFGFTATEVGADGTLALSSDTDATVTLVLPGYFQR